MKITDTEFLNWMIFYSAKISHDRDGESCYVEWYPSNWEWDIQRTKWFGDTREALMDAMKREKEGDWK